VLGDPAMAIFSDNSISINTVYPAAVQTDATSITVSVTASGFPVPELTSVLMKDGIIMGKAVTDVAGKASINFDVPVTTCGQAQLIISGRNLTPITYTIEFVICIGVNNPESNETLISISPNPAYDKVKIEAKLTNSADYIIEIVNAEGKVVLSSTQNHSNNQGRVDQYIDVSSLRAGHYTCILRNGKSNLSKKFIVK
jgi:hypothetical protein